MAVVAIKDANDYHSHSQNTQGFFSDEFKQKIKQGMKSVKAVVHTCDDIASAIFSQSARAVVGGVFITVSLIELEETIEEIKELKKEWAELEKQIAEETDLVKKRRLLTREEHLRLQINIYIFSKYLCWGAVFASAGFTALTIAGISFAGFGFLPFSIMIAIFIKQLSEYIILQDQLNEQCDIYENSPSAKEKEEALIKIAEIQKKQFYKILEICAQTLITISFLAAAVSLSVLSAGSAPFALMIAGAVLGFVFKMYQMYQENKEEKLKLSSDNEKLRSEVTEKDELIARQNSEIVELKQQLQATKKVEPPLKEQKPYEPHVYHSLKKSSSTPNLTKYSCSRFFPRRALEDSDKDNVIRRGDLLLPISRRSAT
jgi:hypothetical protein